MTREALLPFECRQAKISYAGKMTIDVCFQYNDGPIIRENINFGQFPIMLQLSKSIVVLNIYLSSELVQSKLCNLRGADPQKLVSFKEEASEMGGYFILNGLERVIRLLILPKRNYPMSMVRNSFSDRREGYTDKAVVIRCVRADQSSLSIRLYYLRNGSARLGFWLRGREYLLPVGIVLKALIDTTDREIYVNLTSCYNEKYEKGKGAVGTQLVGERAKIILDELRDLALFTRLQCLEYIGDYSKNISSSEVLKAFRLVFKLVVGDTRSQRYLEEGNLPLVGLFIVAHYYYEVAEAVLKDCILVHLDNNFDKFNLLIFMLQKLFSLIDQTSVPDNPDSLQNHEVLLPGHLITLYLKEKLEDWLQKGTRLLMDEIEKKSTKFNFSDIVQVKKVMDKNSSKQVSTAVENMLKTGRLVTQSGLDLQQRAGYTVQAERLNFLRFISHFRAVHRGASFAGLRTTTVRKLLPELVGMTPSLPKIFLPGPPEALTVLLDGCVVGCIASSEVEKVVAHIRELKVSSAAVIPGDMEVGYVPLSMGGAYPGLYLFTSPSRFVRPVKNISIPSNGSENIELIGPFEQVFMEIRCPDGGDGGRKSSFPATHEEIHPTGMLSMAKQTMAFSSQTIQHRADQKLYHIQTPQTPIVRTSSYTKYNIDEFPTGTNAIVAVLAYTGYDMEDAMILNKSSVERGMFHGQIYQTETIDLTEQRGRSDRSSRIFRKSNVEKSAHPSIDSDGLPHVGQMIQPDEPYCSIYNEVTNSMHTFKRKGSEAVYVDYVAVDVKNKKNLQKVNIRFRHPRNPVIGDKFSSRHGQKGVCSQLWPDVDMPFSGTTGMRPDLIINPHAFPSRMTIAMLLESVAAKGGCLRGEFVDATPFRSSVKKDSEGNDSKSGSLVDDLGLLLREKGFNYHGLEVLYSGVYGTELTCEIFIGPVYYQRLRHMVSDKFQVRSTGTVDQVTRQPIKGRKRGGGIRFGEMERDSLLAHGAAYLLHDRLHTCSDYHIADVCSLCGSMLTTTVVQPQKRPVRQIGGLPPGRAVKKVACHACQTSKGMETVAMPYVFRYLAAELAAMNIKMTLKLSDGAEAGA
ncbi:unnamed protein product [Sphenostylis stenocarpa]|uniref:DNA-directed RNA polymerase subunit beta n=1 Tax=Sphenostylis stenocarpa TaxID=92480 RepID=A0AA87B8B5_9FABA|nr:unnamed protein product [Sphenostylis stenocarpa]